ncbi:MAG: hypothetical protein SFX73_25180 [Kofleriaceae bacterium]|nr:hypothetical protein [Kofleriaceae bacterium]
MMVVLGTGSVLWADDQGASAKNPEVLLSNDEIRRRSEKLIVDLEESQRNVQALRTRAEKQKDIIKLTCVNDKLVEVKAQMNIADDQHQQLASAMERDVSESQAIYRELGVTSDSVRKLEEDAIACMGELELYRLESGVEVTHPVIVDDPTAIDPFQIDSTIAMDPPAYASPFD